MKKGKISIILGVLLIAVSAVISFTIVSDDIDREKKVVSDKTPTPLKAKPLIKVNPTPPPKFLTE